MDTVLRTVISKDGTRIAYDQLGSGPAVILVAAALSDRSDVAPLAALLAQRFTVLNYDRRGRGDSGDTAPYAVDREVEDIEALIDAAGGQGYVFGHSSGAVLALEAAARLPQKVTKQALFEPPFIVEDSRPPVPSDYAAKVGELASSGRRSEAVEYFFTDVVGIPPEFVAQMKESPMWPAMQAAAHTLTYDGQVMGSTQAGRPLPQDRWATATAQALVMVGAESGPWLHEAGRALAAILPNAEYRSLDGLDHSAAVMAPDVLAPTLVEFLQGE